MRYEDLFSALRGGRTEASIAMIRIHHDTTLGAAARQMQAAQATVALVVDGGDVPIGVLTERHLLASVAASRHPDHGTAGSWMARVVIDADGHATLPETDAVARVGIGSPTGR